MAKNKNKQTNDRESEVEKAIQFLVKDTENDNQNKVEYLQSIRMVALNQDIAAKIEKKENNGDVKEAIKEAIKDAVNAYNGTVGLSVETIRRYLNPHYEPNKERPTKDKVNEALSVVLGIPNAKLGDFISISDGEKKADFIEKIKEVKKNMRKNGSSVDNYSSLLNDAKKDERIDNTPSPSDEQQSEQKNNQPENRTWLEKYKYEIEQYELNPNDFVDEAALQQRLQELKENTKQEEQSKADGASDDDNKVEDKDYNNNPLRVDEPEDQTQPTPENQNTDWIAAKKQWYESQGLDDFHIYNEEPHGFKVGFAGATVHYTSENDVSISKNAGYKVYATVLSEPDNKGRPVAFPENASEHLTTMLAAAAILDDKNGPHGMQGFNKDKFNPELLKNELSKEDLEKVMSKLELSHQETQETQNEEPANEGERTATQETVDNETKEESATKETKQDEFAKEEDPIITPVVHECEETTEKTGEYSPSYNGWTFGKNVLGGISATHEERGDYVAFEDHGTKLLYDTVGANTEGLEEAYKTYKEDHPVTFTKLDNGEYKVAREGWPSYQDAVSNLSKDIYVADYFNAYLLENGKAKLSIERIWNEDEAKKHNISSIYDDNGHTFLVTINYNNKDGQIEDAPSYCVVVGNETREGYKEVKECQSCKGGMSWESQGGLAKILGQEVLKQWGKANTQSLSTLYSATNQTETRQEVETKKQGKGKKLLNGLKRLYYRLTEVEND